MHQHGYEENNSCRRTRGIKLILQSPRNQLETWTTKIHTQKKEIRENWLKLNRLTQNKLGCSPFPQFALKMVTASPDLKGNADIYDEVVRCVLSFAISYILDHFICILITPDLKVMSCTLSPWYNDLNLHICSSSSTVYLNSRVSKSGTTSTNFNELRLALPLDELYSNSAISCLRLPMRTVVRKFKPSGASISIWASIAWVNRMNVRIVSFILLSPFVRMDVYCMISGRLVYGRSFPLYNASPSIFSSFVMPSEVS